MDYLKTYKSFISSHHLTEGIRMTAGILLPAFILIYFDRLDTGIVLAVGAMCVSVTDNAGPIHHRRNAMLTCTAAIFLVSLVVGYTAHSPWLMGLIVFAFCFFFSMLAVYGTRPGSIGFGALLVMILNMNRELDGLAIILNALYIFTGGLWYTLFSLLLYWIRPHRLIQQVVGDYIQNIAEYLRTRASFYAREVDYEAAYAKLLQQQVNVQEKQNLVNELLFKTTNIVNQSTSIGRILVMTYLDATDLFERVMTSFQDFDALHKFFDETSILEKYNSLAGEIAEDLDEIGIALKSGRSSVENKSLTNHVGEAKEYFNELRITFMTPENIEGFISLRNILDNIEDLSERIYTLHLYTTYDRKLGKRLAERSDPDTLTTHQDITPDIFLDNLSLQSNIFRHSLRVSIAVISGYLISAFFPFGHGYWILLTIIVILKPAYSLTKQRNIDRLIGTLCGVVIGIILLYLIKNSTALLVIMIFLMAGTYTFIRKHYFIGVLLLTPYVILFFHLLNPNDFKNVFADRLIDTIIGSVIAFVASVLVVPDWEHKNIKALMVKMLKENRDYFEMIAGTVMVHQPILMGSHQVARKNAFVALANLSDAFNRMLSEPKSKQIGIDQIKKFVVLNHRLTSHIATLSYYRQSHMTQYVPETFNKAIADITAFFLKAISNLENDPGADKKDSPGKGSLRQLNETANRLLEKRKQELGQGHLETSTKGLLSGLKSIVDQFNFIYNLVSDINKVMSSPPQL